MPGLMPGLSGSTVDLPAHPQTWFPGQVTTTAPVNFARWRAPISNDSGLMIPRRPQSVGLSPAVAVIGRKTRT